MRIAFYFQRVTYLKTMGGLLEAALRQGHEVIVFYEDAARPLGDKSYQVATAETFSNFRIPRKNISGITALSQLRDSSSFDVLVTHEGFHTLRADLDVIAELRKSGVKVISLVHFFEIAQGSLAALNNFDLTIYPSEFCRDLHFRLQSRSMDWRRERDARSGQWAVAGSAMFDQIGVISREDARKELDIAPNAKVVLLMAPVISSNTPWRFYVWGRGSKLSRTRAAIRAGKPQFVWEIWRGHAFEEIVRVLREFCDRESAELIVKSRGKQEVLRYQMEEADTYLTGLDDSYYPVFTSYKLMLAADVCITANSMAAVEAVACGTPCINIYVPHIDLAASWSLPKQRYFDELLSGYPQSLMNYSGCIIKVDRRRIISWLRSAKLEDIRMEPERQKTYTRTFLGMQEQLASDRILEVFERISKTRP
ncbi:MAG: hypothetical protein WEA61_07165 [Anaerolineales bacterium]